MKIIYPSEFRDDENQCGLKLVSYKYYILIWNDVLTFGQLTHEMSEMKKKEKNLNSPPFSINVVE